MSLDAPSAQSISGSAFKVGIVAARFNQRLVDALLNQVVAQLRQAGVPAESIRTVRVPGSAEIPLAVQWLADEKQHDVLIGLGLLIRGDTIHYELIADSATQALQRIAVESRTPVINGIVVAETQLQAEQRCAGEIDRGAEFARSALEMAALGKTFSR